MKRRTSILAAVAAVLGLAACGPGEAGSEAAAQKRITQVSGMIAREIHLTADQRTALEGALRGALGLARDYALRNTGEADSYRPAFTAGGSEWEAARERFRAAREARSPEREILRARLLAEFDPFLQSLSPEQRGALFDLLVQFRARR